MNTTIDYKAIVAARLQEKGLRVLEGDEVDTIVPVLGSAFASYPLYVFFSGGENAEKAALFNEVAIRSGEGRYLVVADEASTACAALMPPGVDNPSLWQFLRNGALRMLWHCGVGALRRSVRFDADTEEVKARHADSRCWYLYLFAVAPECQGKGVGKKLLTPVLDELDRLGCDCYLETFKHANINIYQHLGFSLVEERPLPGSSLTLYAMLRKGEKGRNVKF